MVDLDLEKFFDRVNHDKRMAATARRVSDKRMLKRIRAFLESGGMENGLVSPGEEGTPKEGLCPRGCRRSCSTNWTESGSDAGTVSCATRRIAISTGRANERGSESCKA